MLIYVLRRLLALIPVLFLLSMVGFSFVYFMPGDVIDRLVGEEEVDDPAVRAALEDEFGLNKPLYVQYSRWLGRVICGDFGTSLVTRRPVSLELFNRIPATIYLACGGMTLAILIAVPLGALAAIKRNTLFDYAAQTSSLIGISIADFWLAMMGIFVFSLSLNWLPTSGYISPFTDPIASLRHLLLPAVVIGIGHAAYTTRLTRASMLEELRKDYVDTARSSGLPERKVLYKYTLRNALLPTVTISGLQLAQLLGGTVVIETIFAWPGIGLGIYEAIGDRDYPLIQAGILVTGTIVVMMNLLIDLTYRALNPRVQLGF